MEKNKQQLLVQHGFEPTNNSNLSPYNTKTTLPTYEKHIDVGNGRAIIAFITPQTILELDYSQLYVVIQTVLADVDKAIRLIHQDSFKYLQ